MQATQQTMQVVGPCPKPDPVQVQANIENMRWQEKQQEIAGVWERQYRTQQAATEHEHYMVDHLATPIVMICVAVILAFVAMYISRLHAQTDIAKNHDDNQSDVRRAQEILHKHEGIEE